MADKNWSSACTGQYDAAALVTEVLKELYNNEQACMLCLCRDDIMSTLLSPIAQFLDDSSVSVLEYCSFVGVGPASLISVFMLRLHLDSAFVMWWHDVCVRILVTSCFCCSCNIPGSVFCLYHFWFSLL